MDKFLTRIKFKFFDAEGFRWEIPSVYGEEVSDETLTFHSDPFFAECRAYGKINKYYEDMDDKARRRHQRIRPEPGSAKKKQLAVPCYGYITVAAEYEKMLQKKFDVWEWDRSEEEELGEIAKRPFRALVKELVTSPVSVLNPRRMLGDLKKLRKLEIFARDIYARNYKAGFLVDFSVAWTAPHWCLEVLGPYQRKSGTNSELGLFDLMIEEEGIKTSVRATRSWRYCRKLRSWGKQDKSETV